MKTADFSFELPGELVAQYPPAERGDSRLMVLDRVPRRRGHHVLADLPSLLEPGSLLVFNKSRVRKGRLRALSKNTRARVEFLLLKKLDHRTWQVMAQRTKRRRPGSRYIFEDGTEGEITGAHGNFLYLCFDTPPDEAWFDRYGRLPLPPYIKREDGPLDDERYQTVYADMPGSAAAPTAGLHFTRELLGRLEAAGMETAFVTLHVGLGTFLPVRTEDIEDHPMHEEVFIIDEKTARRITQAKGEGRRIVAVGTTSVRALESAWNGGRLRHGEQATSIFIYPGYRFKAVDVLFTNFHTPQSTLLMLVSAFAEAPGNPAIPGEPGAVNLPGREFILESYAEGIREGYRFFSYGDAMLIR